MRKIKMMVIGILVAGVVVGLCGASWGAPMKINVQGRLEYTTSITPGTITFKIWEGGDESGGGRDVWVDKRGIIKTGIPGPDQVLLDPETKIFNVVLGPKDDTDRDLPEFLTDNYYLEILVESETLAPRQRLVSVPYAITAKNLKGGVVYATTTAIDVYPVYGVCPGQGAVSGVYGTNSTIGSNAGPGVRGRSLYGHGVYGSTEARGTPRGAGVYGEGPYVGVYGNGDPAVEGVSKTDNAFKGRLGYNPGSMFKAGVMGEAGAQTTGHLGLWTATGNTYYGVRGFAFDGDTNYGVYGEGGNYGVYGKSPSYGVYGRSTSTTYTPPWPFYPVGAVVGAGDGLAGVTAYSLQNYAVFGITGSTWAGVGGSNLGSGAGVRGESQGGIGVYGKGVTAGGSFESTDGLGVYARGSRQGAVRGEYTDKVYGVLGRESITLSGRNNYGVFGYSVPDSDNGYGVYGWGKDAGVYGGSSNGYGVRGVSSNGIGVFASDIAAGNADSPFKVKTYSITGLAPHAFETFNIGVSKKVFNISGTYGTTTRYWYQIPDYHTMEYPSITMSYDANTGGVSVGNNDATRTYNINVMVVYSD